MQVLMKQIVSFHQNSDAFMGKTLPLKGAFKINKIKKDTENELEFYQNKFKEIVEKFSKKDENGQIQFSEDGEQILIQEDKLAECNQELQDLEEMEIEVDNYDLVIDELGNIDCTPEELEVLMPFIQ